MSTERPFALIAGGGTGGHVYPALAVAEALVARGHDKGTIRFVGSSRGLEARVLPGSGYQFKLLPGRGIKRRLSFDNFSAVAGLLVGLAQAVALMLRGRPSVVVSVGGYAAAPCAFAAAMLKVPLVLVELNAVPGAVNRLVGRAAAASAVALPGTALPRSTVTGSPVRSEISNLDRSAQSRVLARKALGLPEERVVVASFGGSLGSSTINRSVIDLAARWRDRNDIAIHHVVGRRDWNDSDFARPDFDLAGLCYRAVEYENHMLSLYAAADVVICRSGAATVAEVALAGLPAVFVPLPNAPGDHQTANALVFERVNAAFLVPDADCSGARLDDMLTALIDHPETIRSMGAAARGLANPDAADRVAAIVEECAAGKPGAK